MNQFQINLYKNLQALTNLDSFFSIDHEKDGIWYKVFSYRLASYTAFLYADALECRGTMFRMNDDGTPAELVALPFKKFFNLNENNFTENVDFTNAKFVCTKEDGSLISSYLHNGRVALKSKTSLSSEQAIDATEWLYKTFYAKENTLLTEIDSLASAGFTVNMEWVSPNNRIVLGYNRPRLIVIGIRDMSDGSPVYPDDEIGRAHV